MYAFTCIMATNVVKTAICSIITDPDCTERSKAAEEQARVLLHTTEVKCMQTFEQFCVSLTKTVEKNFLLVCLAVKRADPKVY